MRTQSERGVQAEKASLALAYRPVVRGYLFGAGLYYLLITAAHLYSETGWMQVALPSLAAATALICLRARHVLDRGRPSLLTLEMATIAANALMFANVASYLSVHLEAEKLVYFVLMALAFAVASPTRRVMLPSVGISLATMALFALKAGGPYPELYLYIGLAGAFLALGMSELMRDALNREVRARLAAEASAARLEEEGRRIAVLQAETHELALKAQAASRAKSEFLGTISHELRTPLNAILGLAQALSPAMRQPGDKAHLDTLQAEARGLKQLIDDLLDIVSLESGGIELHPAAFDMGGLIDDLGAAFEPIAVGKGLAFTITCEPNARTWCNGDEALIRRVLSNLISNAIKFTDRGGVGVSVRRDGDGISFSVVDTGIGIAPDEQEKMFDHFAQADGAMTRRFGGAGLGLAICRQLVELMSGEISVDSRPGEGASFSFHAPMAAVRARARTGAGVELEVRPLNLLIVDDNHINRLVLETLLSQAGLATRTVRNGREAVDMWALGQWDAILMDIHMPEMDGLAATREIRAREAAQGCPRTPIIAVTASVLDHETAAYMDAGMDGCVAKPIEFAHLTTAIENAVGVRVSPRAKAA